MPWLVEWLRLVQIFLTIIAFLLAFNWTLSNKLASQWADHSCKVMNFLSLWANRVQITFQECCKRQSSFDNEMRPDDTQDPFQHYDSILFLIPCSFWHSNLCSIDSLWVEFNMKSLPWTQNFLYPGTWWKFWCKGSILTPDDLFFSMQTFLLF